ncbi:MAG: hypothetical protein ACLRFL_00880 [Clostridia bacterium]
MAKQGKLIQKILFVVLAISTAFICLSFGIRKESRVYAVSTKTTIGDVEYSAKFGGDVIFTAERVGIVADSEGYKAEMQIATNSEVSEADAKRVYDNENQAQYYIDIASGSKSKSVMDNGDVVMLYNDAKIGDYHYNKNLVGYSGNSLAKVSEAILISFGQFVYSTPEVDGVITEYVDTPKKADPESEERLTAGIYHHTSATIAHNNTTTDIKFRTHDVEDIGTYYDFSYLITQNEQSAGYYKIVIESYSIGGESFSAEFEFYLLFNSTYSANIEEGNHQYSAKPTLSWYNPTSKKVEANGNANATLDNGFYRYYVGEDGMDNNNVYYPTLTYDYTKYSMNYDHTANNKKTNYKYEFDFETAKKVNNSNMSDSAPMKLTITSGRDGANVVTKPYELNATYRKDNANNLVSIVLTEPGTYVFYYDYIYAGFVPDDREAPNMAEYIKISYAQDLAKNVSIHGFELEYSKYEYTEAELKHLTLANNSEKIGCIVPDGVLESKLEDYKNKAIGFTYEFDDSSNARVGTVIKSEQAMVNMNGADEDKDGIDDNITKLLNVTTYDVNYNPAVGNNIDTILSNIKDKYINTNQGSLWFKYNDSFVSSLDTNVGNLFSKYFYSANVIDSYDDLFTKKEKIVGGVGTGEYEYILNATNFTNATTFNKTGYYLAIIGVKTDTGKVFWQVYAFKYTTDTIDINVNAVEYNADGSIKSADQVVGAGKYTGNDVKISWEPASKFEREIKAYYYTTTDIDLSIQQIINSSNPKDIEHGDILGQDIEKSFLKYLVVLESVGGSKTYRIFTIDRQDISGLSAIAVKKTFAMNGYYYSVALNSANKPKVINSGITDSMATLTWNNKASGAKISAEYTFTPFVKIEKTDATVKEIKNGNDYWYTTNYKLGDTIGSFDYSRAESMTNIKYSSSIIEDQGIYVFTLTDEAGNSCRYMLVIDGTEAYFKIGSDYLTNASKIYSNNTNIYVSSHKVFVLEKQEAADDSERGILQNLIEKMSIGEYKNTNYFSGNGTNFGNLKSIFTRYSNDNQYYLTIKNNTLNVYDNQQISGEVKDIVSLSKDEGGYYYTMYKPTSGSSIVNTFYLLGANNEYSGKTNSAENSKSYIKVEINTDNSLGRVFASDNAGDFENVSKSKIDNYPDQKRVNAYTTDGDKWIENNDNFAKATSANYVMFSWIVGTGIFEVGEVKYQYYQLDTTKNYDSNTRYYSKSGSPIIAYNNTANASAGCSVTSDGYGILKLYQRTSTNDGLYVITRTYKDSGDVDYGDDKKTLNYYFIVDKNGIYEVIDPARNNIYLNVLGNETDTSEFTGGTSPDQPLGVGDKQYNYKIYYETNKVPATLSIPMGKYLGLDKKNTTDYYAGRLRYDLYFIDSHKQLTNEQTQYKIATGKVTAKQDGYFTINLRDNNEMKDSMTEIISRFLVKDNSGKDTDWLALPGRYVLVLQDNVLDPNGNNHYFAMGFDISITKPIPNVEIESGYSDEQTDNESIGADYTLYTSNEYVKIALPKYLDDELKTPQVDQYYFDIKKDGNTNLYYHYSLDDSGYTSTGKLPDNALDKFESDGHTIIETIDGVRYLYLKTDIKNEDGSWNLSPTTYTVTVRYKLSDDSVGDKYINAYYYYNNSESTEKITYYETTYTINIDRMAPTTNVNNLISNDNIIKYYDETTDDFFTHYVYGGESSQARYTYQYKDYYESVLSNKTDKSLIYGFRVDRNTDLYFDDIYEIRYRSFDADTDSLGLPIATSAGYTTMIPSIKFKDKSSIKYIDEITVGGYYEILEIDRAGNMTQYVIYLDADENKEEDTVNISFTVDTPQKSGETLLLTNDTVSIFSIVADSTEVIGNRFYHISVSKDDISNITTNFMTDISNLDDQIAGLMKTFGRYTITISDAIDVKIVTVLNYYDRDSSTQLNPKDVFISVNGVYHIDLSKAKAIDVDTGATYYAEQITIYEDNIATTYYSNNGIDFYSDENFENKLDNTLLLCKGNTYKVFMTDSIDRPYYTVFNLDGSSEYTGVDVESKNYYQAENKTFYTFGDFYIWYNTSIYSKSDIKIVGNQDYVTINDSQGIINISNNGKSITEYFNISFSNTIDNKVYAGDSYAVLLDSNVGDVSLKDNASGDEKDMLVAYNTEPTGDLPTITGIMSLNWNRLQNEYFTYEYTLYETMADNTINDEIFNNGEISYTINTSSQSQGLYRFVINVYSNDENNILLGSKIFKFDVQGIGNKIYKVTYLDQEVKSNATFVFSDLKDYSAKLAGYPMESKVAYPMYISNLDLSVKTINQGGIEVSKESVSLVTDVLTLYKISLGDYPQYVLILKVKDLMGALVNGLSIVRSNEDGEVPTMINEDNYMGIDVVGLVSDTISLAGIVKSALDTIEVSANILKKNTLIIDIFYRLDNTNYTKVTSREIVPDGQNKFSLPIMGNGAYSFSIRDKAGNVHTIADADEFKVNILRKVAVAINGMTPVNNAYYNGEVEMTIPSSSIYKNITVSATKDGQYYNIEYKNPYIFSGYGYFIVNVQAIYHDHIKNEDVELTNVIKFSIINEKEARTSIDLTNLSAFQITKVLDNRGDDCTYIFVTKIVNPNIDSGMLLSYDRLIEHFSEDLGISSGMYTFTITYEVVDQYNMYPTSEITFAFALNNDIPDIDCSLKAGESTKKGFNITFDASAIYEQIGESFIYINDQIVAEINENSGSGQTKVSRTFKADGTGDYYIKLVTSSGTILSSYKVSIKEPLNTWAIILIVVVAAIVITTVVVIIVLRHKMRIR